MGAFIVAAIVMVITLGATALEIGGGMMSDNPGVQAEPWPILIGGSLIAALVTATHWMPHLGW